MAKFVALLVARRKFSTVSLNFLMVRHTHEDVGQLFAMLCLLVLRKYRFQNPAELAAHLRDDFKQYVVDRGEECKVIELKNARGFNNCLDLAARWPIMLS